MINDSELNGSKEFLALNCSELLSIIWLSFQSASTQFQSICSSC